MHEMLAHPIIAMYPSISQLSRCRVFESVLTSKDVAMMVYAPKPHTAFSRLSEEPKDVNGSLGLRCDSFSSIASNASAAFMLPPYG